MSDINDDKKVLEGRKEPLKDVAAPLRDQIVEKLHKKLVEMDIGHKVHELWEQGNSNRASWLERQKAYLASWDEHLLGDTEGPFDGSSNLHIPMPYTVAKTVHARFMQAIFGVDPPFHAKARNEASIERVAPVSDSIRYAIQDWSNYGKGVEEVCDQWLWNWITAGTGLKKWRWDCKYTRFIDVQQVPKPGPTQYSVDENGKEVMQPTIKLVDEEVKVTKKIFDGPVCDLLNPEDLLIIGGEGDPDVADAVIHRQMLTASELWTLVDRKVFKEDAVKAIIEGGPDHVEGSTAQDIKSQRAMNAGIAQLDTSQDLDRYEIAEAYLRLDVDGSGINSDVIVWVHPRSGELCRSTYLHRVSISGERPFVKIDFHKRPGHEYGVGLVELLYPLSKELDMIRNMRLDFGMLSVMPFGFFRPSSGIEPENIQLEPGALIPVDNPQTDVYFPNLGNRTSFGFQEEAAIYTMVERLTAISDLSLGVMNGQGATRTATGARALVGEMSSNLDVYLRRLNRGWKKSLRYLLHMLQQRMPDGLSFRLTGDDGKDYWRQIKNSKDLAGDFDIEVSPNSQSSNAGIQQETASQILQLTSNPLNIQLGLVGPLQQYEAVKNFLQSYGVKDYGRYLMKPQGQDRNLTPEEEANRILRGIDVPVTANMDHQGFIDFFQYILKHDEILGQFNEEQTIMLAKQAKQHEQMLMALQAVAAQAANARQMQTNAAMSAQQAPTGLNPLAGGPGA